MIQLPVCSIQKFNKKCEIERMEINYTFYFFLFWKSDKKTIDILLLVYQGKTYNDQIDIYSLGSVLYCLMIHNRLPFYPPITQAITFNGRENALQ